MTYPWEQLPAVTAEPSPPVVMSTKETVAALQRDFAYAMTHTAVLVHSTRTELRMLVNTARGQIVPRGECKFTDGTTIEFQDIGMPQPNTDALTVAELVRYIYAKASELGLELQP